VKISTTHTGDPELDGWTFQAPPVYELYSTMCIKPLRKTLLDFEYRTILPSHHSDSLKIHTTILDE
jgi:hypothetical protein